VRGQIQALGSSCQVLRAHGISRRVVGKPRPQRGIDSLTDSELKVAHLVAGGATNRAVAQRLFLSPHTVNSHLRNASAKLGIRSRTELGRFINPHHEPAVDESWPN
jgi:DNA-binding CsgD family transcriptional regulator